ncbi:MAG: DUF1501 domain-containing protein [Fuerstiella sp.]|nr:DUF1501 domain-containing protein [Fuerstiella sp.]
MAVLPDTPTYGTRREALRSLGAGISSVALADLLFTNQASGSIAPMQHFVPRAKHVIFLFMRGGPSHLDLLDPKPLIKTYAGQRPESVKLRTERVTRGLMPSPFKFRRYGQSGTEVSDLFPNIGQCVDDICVLRSVVGGNPNHAPAGNWMFSGRIDQIHPTLGAWMSHGLGTENRNLPGFVSLRKVATPSRYVRHGYLPGEHQATPIDVSQDTPDQMIAHLQNSKLAPADQHHQFDFLQQLNRKHQAGRGNDAVLEARIRSMETGFRMQFTAGEACDLNLETQSLRQSYGEGWFADGCLLARRLVERGVRYVQLEINQWDHHSDINRKIREATREVDQPIAALLKDLKQRGLLDETLVVWGGEFGRTPVSENGNGRDHNHYGFSMWMAGGGIRGGMTYGATDDFGFKAVKNIVTVHDLHATILYLLGLDHERLTYRYSGRDFRLTDIHGNVVEDIIA